MTKEEIEVTKRFMNNELKRLDRLAEANRTKIKHPEHVRYPAEFIFKKCAHYFLKTQEEFIEPNNSPVIAHPRFMIYILLRKYTDATYKAIGRRFGGRDHSSILAGIKRMTGFLEVDSRYKDIFDDLELNLFH